MEKLKQNRGKTEIAQKKMRQLGKFRTMRDTSERIERVEEKLSALRIYLEGQKIIMMMTIFSCTAIQWLLKNSLVTF